MKRFKNKGPKIKDTTKIRLGGLFKTIFLTAILCMAIPVFIVSFTTINSVRDELAETSDTNLTQIATEKDNQISAMIEDQIEIAQTLANTPFIVESVSEKVSANNTDIDYDICDYLKTIADSRDGLYENLFVTAGTMFIADSHDGETAHDVSEETSYQTCIANGGYVGKELSPTSGLPVLIIDMPIT
ncbi:MAG: cache domain-containing protein, partial [Lachnospiraceae bacterium]|nr:cache domain-containing protein [Lachnospiraceae bacterium]